MQTQHTTPVDARLREQAAAEHLLAVCKDIAVTETYDLVIDEPGGQQIDQHRWLSRLLAAINRFEQDVLAL